MGFEHLPIDIGIVVSDVEISLKLGFLLCLHSILYVGGIKRLDII